MALQQLDRSSFLGGTAKAVFANVFVFERDVTGIDEIRSSREWTDGGHSTSDKDPRRGYVWKCQCSPSHGDRMERAHPDAHQSRFRIRHLNTRLGVDHSPMTFLRCYVSDSADALSSRRISSCLRCTTT